MAQLHATPLSDPTSTVWRQLIKINEPVCLTDRNGVPVARGRTTDPRRHIRPRRSIAAGLRYLVELHSGAGLGSSHGHGWCRVFAELAVICLSKPSRWKAGREILPRR